jgi:hypothetical protein
MSSTQSCFPQPFSHFRHVNAISTFLLPCHHTDRIRMCNVYININSYFFLRLNLDTNSVMMCWILIFIIFRSQKSNFEYPDMDMLQINTNTECSYSKYKLSIWVSDLFQSDDWMDNNICITFHPHCHPHATLTSFDIGRPSLGFPDMPPRTSQHQIPRKI